MAKKIFNFQNITAELVALLKAEGIAVERVLLYGSWARGNAHDYSDIDIVIISDDLKKYEAIERLEFLSKIAWKCSEPIEIMGYTTEEIKGREGKSIFWDEIVQTSKEIYKAA